MSHVKSASLYLLVVEVNLENTFQTNKREDWYVLENILKVTWILGFPSQWYSDINKRYFCAQV